MEEKQLGLTPKQREWVLRRDENQCQFIVLGNGEPYKCRSEVSLQVHHISPKEYSFITLGWKDKQVNSPENCITLGKIHHLEYVHFDYGVMARKLYKYSGESYSMIGVWHKALAKEGVKYWIPYWDDMMRMTARLRTWEYLQKNPDDLFPFRKEKKR